MSKKIFKLDLQLFAEGGEGAAAASVATGAEGASQATGDNTAQNPTEQNGGTSQNATDDRQQAYAKFKADFKAEYDAEVQGLIKDRLKNAKNFEKSAKEYQGKTGKILDALAVKYGIDASNIDAIVAEVEKDNSYYEAEAFNRGMSVDEFRHVKQVETENARLKAERDAQFAREEQQKWYDSLAQQAHELKQKFPSFDMDAESKNPTFVRLIENGCTVESAYKAVHADEIAENAMRYAVAETAKNMQVDAQYNAQRPPENGAGQSAAVTTGIDVNKLTDEQIDDLIRRHRNGEKISFT